jgi:hypothetical protein
MVRDLLIETRVLLSEPGAWIQGHYGIDANGNPVHPFDENLPACRWCLVGAMCLAGIKLRCLGLITEALDMLAIASGIPKWEAAQWNDWPGRTQAEVLALLDKAIG